jgi:hypothetical protein
MNHWCFIEKKIQVVFKRKEIIMEIKVIKEMVAEKVAELEGKIDNGGLKGVRENTDAELRAWREVKQMIDNVTE